jgi:hypothetical protein
MVTIRRIGLAAGLLAACAIAMTQVALTLAAPMPKPVVGTAYQTSGGTNIGNANYTTVADMVLPAGKYHVTARGLVNNQTGVPVNVISCNAYAANTIVDSGSASAPMSYAGFSIDGTADLPTGGTVRVECISDSTTLPYPSVGISLVAVSVAGIVALP